MEQQIHKLKQIKQDTGILSIYLGSEKHGSLGEHYLSLFHSLITHSLTQKEKKQFIHALEKIEHYLRETYTPYGQSIALFTDKKNFFEALPLSFFISSSLIIASAPHLKPLEQAQREQHKYLVLLVDRTRARLFTVQAGVIQEHKDIIDKTVPQNVRANEQDFYGRSDKIFRHIEDHLHRHLAKIASETVSFMKKTRPQFILLGGHKELLHKMKDHLTNRIQHMIQGEFVTELNIPLQKVLIKSNAIAQKV